MKKIDISGEKFGRLLALKPYGKTSWGAITWLFLCDCGNEIITRATYVKIGHTKSCGCLQVDRIIETKTIHGQKNTPEYKAWTSMKSRCYNPNDYRRKTYSLRGITVCDRWINSFENFINDMGKRPASNYSLDRYPNNNGNYEPGNCRWATNEQQQKNTTRSKKLEYNGHVMIQADWAKIFKTSQNNIKYHLNKGRSFEWIYKHYMD